MTKTVLVTVSDDRFGRKEGQYARTQASIPAVIGSHVHIDKYLMATWADIESSYFYKENEILLRNKDAARNGRAYKPYVIKQALDTLNEGDFLIYTDCSPEMWNHGFEFEFKYFKFNIRQLHELCAGNKGILTPFVKWDTRFIPTDGLGRHTHANFTTERCIEEMGYRRYRSSFMHASGMVILQKNNLSSLFVDTWLFYNLIPACACLGDPAIPDDYSYWDDNEDRYKMGHRHDQSISGLLVNGLNPMLIDPPPAHFHPYNFLNYCRPGWPYSFINSNTPVEPRKINKGDSVKNAAGMVLRVFEIWPGPNGTEKYIVGLHRESAYQTTEDKLTPI